MPAVRRRVSSHSRRSPPQHDRVKRSLPTSSTYPQSTSSMTAADRASAGRPASRPRLSVSADPPAGISRKTRFAAALSDGSSVTFFMLFRRTASVQLPDSARGTEQRSGSSRSRIACGSQAIEAPCAISWLQPSDSASPTRPGTANTSRPCSSAKSAVMRDPERCRASTTRTMSASPLMMRFLAGKWYDREGVPGGCSDRIPPVLRSYR